MPETKTKPGVGSLVVRPLLAGMVAAGAATPIAAPAADELFLRIAGIQGESQSKGHEGDINLLSYSQSFTHPAVAGGAGGGSATGRTNCGEVRVTKVVDRSTPALISRVVTGKHIQKAVITFRKSGEQAFEYYTVTLTDVVFTAITQSDASGDSATILEQLSMSAARFKFDYKPQKADGSAAGTLSFGWDCAANKAL